MKISILDARKFTLNFNMNLRLLFMYWMIYIVVESQNNNLFKVEHLKEMKSSERVIILPAISPPKAN